jgi:hypothetical protein
LNTRRNNLGSLKLLIVFTIAACGLILQPPAFSKDGVSIIGTGTFSCGKWISAVDEKNDAQRRLVTQWIAGFVSAYNVYSMTNKLVSPPITLVDLETADLWVTSYCKNNPTHSVINAAQALVQDLGGEKTKYSWKR